MNTEELILFILILLGAFIFGYAMGFMFGKMNGELTMQKKFDCLKLNTVDTNFIKRSRLSKAATEEFIDSDTDKSPEELKEEALAALKRTGVINEDGTPKDNIVDEV